MFILLSWRGHVNITPTIGETFLQAEIVCLGTGELGSEAIWVPEKQIQSLVS